MPSIKDPKLNILGKAWYSLQLIFVLVLMGITWLWALPGFFIQWALTKLGRKNALNDSWVLFFWLGPFILFSFATSKPQQEEVPEWARKREKTKT